MTTTEKNSTSLKNIPETFDTIIVGGGIVGAGIFRDLSLHGIKTLIVDKRDFGSQTSQSSSKMFHGGIRYLESFDLFLVWEALHEKNLWIKNAPHLCKELPFNIPTYKESKNPKWQLALGVKIYDFLSGFKNSPSKVLSEDKTISLFPEIKTKSLTGSVQYYDAVVDDAKMAIDNIIDGELQKNSSALNYTEFVSFEKESKSPMYKVLLKDTFTGLLKTIKTPNLIFAVGPFTDDLLLTLEGLNWEKHLLPTKGSHIWLTKDSLNIKTSLVLQTKDNRILFVIPYSNKILAGTTEIAIDNFPLDISPDKSEVDYIIENINEYFPKASVDKNNIISTYAGIRPLVKSSSKLSANKISRAHKVIKPLPNIFVIMGGKLTTFRVMGQQISKEIIKSFSKKYDPDKTKALLSYKSPYSLFSKKLKNISKEAIINIIKIEHPKTFQDLMIRRLGIPSRGHWDFEMDFNDFFHSIKDDLYPYLNISDEDINSF